MLNMIIAAFVLVAIAVLVMFRSPIPSFTVVFGAANDILVALGVMAVLGIPLGVCIDRRPTHADRLFDRHGHARGDKGTEEDGRHLAERAFSAMKTGMTMTSAAILSFAVLFIVSYFTFIPDIFRDIRASCLRG